MSPIRDTKDEKGRRRDGRGRYAREDTGVAKPKAENRGAGPANGLSQQDTILGWLFSYFVIQTADVRHFVPVNCKQSPLKLIYDLCVHPKVKAGAHTFAKALRKWDSESEHPGHERCYVWERSKKYRTQVEVLKSKRLPHPNDELEANAVKTFLQELFQDGTLKQDSVQEAWEDVKKVLLRYGKIEGTDEFGYFGFPKKGLRKKSRRKRLGPCPLKGKRVVPPDASSVHSTPHAAGPSTAIHPRIESQYPSRVGALSAPGVRVTGDVSGINVAPIAQAGLDEEDGVDPNVNHGQPSLPPPPEMSASGPVHFGPMPIFEPQEEEGQVTGGTEMNLPEHPNQQVIISLSNNEVVTPSRRPLSILPMAPMIPVQSTFQFQSITLPQNRHGANLNENEAFWNVARPPNFVENQSPPWSAFEGLDEIQRTVARSTDGQGPMGIYDYCEAHGTYGEGLNADNTGYGTYLANGSFEEGPRRYVGERVTDTSKVEFDNEREMALLERRILDAE